MRNILHGLFFFRRGYTRIIIATSLQVRGTRTCFDNACEDYACVLHQNGTGRKERDRALEKERVGSVNQRWRKGMGGC